MAKFALVGYGSDGRGLGKTEQGYTYVVNDNVRTGDTIQPIATSSRGRKFATTGVINHSYKETSVKGQEARLKVISKEDKDISKALDRRIRKGDFSVGQLETEEKRRDREVTQVYTGAEVGLSRSGVSRKQYQQEVRGANLSKYVQKHPQSELTEHAYQTFEEYSKPFMKRGE